MSSAAKELLRQAGGMEASSPAVPEAPYAAMRAAVLAFKASEPRRNFPAVVHVGTPGGRVASFVDLPADRLDHGLRTEVMAALLSRALLHDRQPVTWLTRSGGLGTHDADLAWLAAARSAYGEADVPLAMAVVTRDGWRDPRTGRGATWKRLRDRRGTVERSELGSSEQKGSPAKPDDAVGPRSGV